VVSQNEELLTVRGVAEFAYCPRLFFFRDVEGVFVPSADTEEGELAHRAVDRASLLRGDLDGGIVRSLALSSDRLGITGVLDITRITGKEATPVEYRKVSPRCPSRETPHRGLATASKSRCRACSSRKQVTASSNVKFTT
jgi:CRISPR/Cas system-associated exonuclease Cas4 (RecB family)